MVEMSVGDTSVPYRSSQMPLDLPGGEATGIQAQHFRIEALQAPLALFHKLRRKAPVAVARHLQVQRPRVRLHGLLALAVAGVASSVPWRTWGA